MQPTRWEILRLLKRHGRATVHELSRALDMTLMGVRLHLMVLDRDGYVQRTTVREKPGRPALVYSLTPRAEELFPKQYDLLAEKLLASLEQKLDPSLASDLLASAALDMADPLAAQVKGADLEERVASVSRLLDQNGSFGSWERVEGGFLFRSFNCLFYSVARRNRMVCTMDRLLLQRILGAEVEQRESLMDGAACCSFFVPESE